MTKCWPSTPPTWDLGPLVTTLVTTPAAESGHAYIKAAPAAALARPPAGLSLRPARRTPGHSRRRTQIKAARLSRRPVRRIAVFLAPIAQLPARHLSDSTPGRRTRSAAPTIDPAATSKDSRLRGKRSRLGASRRCSTGGCLPAGGRNHGTAMAHHLLRCSRNPAGGLV